MKKNNLFIVLILTLMAGVLLDLAPLHVPDGIDKIYHFVGFAVISVLAILTFVEFFGKKSINLFLLSVMSIGGFFAAISEFLQKLTAVRDCDVNDWLVDLLGITLICIVAFLIYAKQKKELEINQATFDFKDIPVLL